MKDKITNLKNKVTNTKNKVVYAGIGAFTAALSCPALALADKDVEAGAMLSEIMGKLSTGVGLLGAVLIIMGAVNLGLTIKDGMQGGGGQLAGALAMLIGGAIIVAAAVYFGTLKTSDLVS